jgi:hypothetical protein
VERGGLRAGARALAQRLNSPLGAALLTLLAYALFIVARLHALDGDVTRFVDAGDQFIPVASARSLGLSVQPRSYGYDGQFYYLLALNPFSAQPAAPGAHFDLPAYRAQRILYPLLVWLLSLGGQPALVPAMLVVVNLGAIVAIGAIGARLAQRLGVAPLWGTLLAFYPGLLLSLGRDLAEPLAMACALGGVLCARDRRWGWVALLLSLAVLARETTAIFAVALLVVGLMEGLFTERIASRLKRIAPSLGPSRREVLGGLLAGPQWPFAVLAGLTPLLVALSWQAVLLLHWGKPGLLAAGGNNLGLPFVGLFEGFVAWRILWPPLLQAMQYLDVAYLLGLAEVTRRLLRRQLRIGFLALAWAGFLVLTLCLTVFVWDYYWNFLRGALELAMLSLLLLLTASPRLRRSALIATLALWLVTFIASAPEEENGVKGVPRSSEASRLR